MPFFSIIIPVFNSADTIKIALASIQNQNFDDVEVIIIDGGSNDDTSNLANVFWQGNRLPFKLISELDKWYLRCNE